MNHDQFRRCIGQTLRLEPQAIGPANRPVDDDWTVTEVDQPNRSATLRNLTRGGDVVVGFDHVRGYDTDPARGQNFGFLTMLSQIRIGRDGTITGRPIAPRPGAAPAPELNPLVVNDGQQDRHLTWASRDGAIAQLIEGEARQLYGTFVAVCNALRRESGREPQFNAPNDIRHEIVWELTPDHLSRHKLLGGMNGAHAIQVLVLTADRARPGVERIANAAPPEVENVDLNYPDRSGLQARVVAAGFRLHWVREELVGRRRGEGWEVVVVDLDGRRVSFRVPPGAPDVDPSALVLMKRRA